ncbi:MAG: hypothetical protein IJF34_05510 [Clostridia bacterium]|nr:hypothetical protein [Clostridia bacterium]
MNPLIYENYHKHSPSKQENVLKRIWDFFLHRKDLFYVKDNTGECSICGAPIKVPHEYYHPLAKFMYFLGGILVYLLDGLLLAVLWPYSPFDMLLWNTFWISIIFCPLGIMFFERVIMSVILSVYPWVEYDEEKFDVSENWKRARWTRVLNFVFAYLGFETIIKLLTLIFTILESTT